MIVDTEALKLYSELPNDLLLEKGWMKNEWQVYTGFCKIKNIDTEIELLWKNKEGIYPEKIDVKKRLQGYGWIQLKQKGKTYGDIYVGKEMID